MSNDEQLEEFLERVADVRERRAQAVAALDADIADLMEKRNQIAKGFEEQEGELFMRHANQIFALHPGPVTEESCVLVETASGKITLFETPAGTAFKVDTHVR